MKTKKILFCFIFISIYIQNIFSEKVYLEVSSGVSKWVYTISIEEYNKQGKIIYEKTFLAGGAAWRERRFEYDKKDLSLVWRGSRNQRVIDMNKTKDKVVLYCE